MRLTSHCYAVTGLACDPPWTVNAGFVVGDSTTLVVDTGSNALAAATIYGYALGIRPTNRLIAINTEHHFEHLGGNSYFRQRGVDIYGHLTVQLNAGAFDTWQQRIEQSIIEPMRRRAGEAQLFFDGTTAEPPNVAITSEGKFDLGGLEARVLLTPGHTPASLSVLVPSEGILYASASIVTGYIPVLEEGEAADWKVWLDSMDRFQELAPKIVVPGHGPVLEGDAIPREMNRIRGVLQDAITRRLPPSIDYVGWPV